MENLDQIVDSMREKGRKINFYGGAEEGSIRTLEDALDVALPPSYREFLLTYGGGGPEADRPIAGIYRDQPLLDGAGSVYGETMDARDEFGIPRTCVVIFRDDDTSVIWCIDTACPSGTGECPVVSIDPLTGRVDQQISPSFEPFVVEHFRLRA